MNSLVEARVRSYLTTRLKYSFYECGAILFRMNNCARMAGFDLDSRFADAGLGAGPDARLASSIVNRAMGRAGDGAAEGSIRAQIARWLQSTNPMGH